MGQVEKPKASEVVIPPGPATAAMFPVVKLPGGVKVSAYVAPKKAGELVRWLNNANSGRMVYLYKSSAVTAE